MKREAQPTPFNSPTLSDTPVDVRIKPSKKRIRNIPNPRSFISLLARLPRVSSAETPRTSLHTSDSQPPELPDPYVPAMENLDESPFMSNANTTTSEEEKDLSRQSSFAPTSIKTTNSLASNKSEGVLVFSPELLQDMAALENKVSRIEL